MKRVIISMLIFALIFPALAHAGQTGPLWAVWKHSEKPEHCALKTVFWMALVTTAVVYAANKMTSDVRHQTSDARLKTLPGWQAATWVERDGQGKEYAVTGFKISW